jgi:hypothetical protein
MELVLVAIAVLLNLSGRGRVNLYVIPPMAVIATFAITFWLGLKIKSKLVEVCPAWCSHRGRRHPHVRRPDTRATGAVAILVAKALKVIGGAAAGVVLARRQSATRLVSETQS